MRVKFLLAGVALAALLIGGNAWADSLGQEWRGCASDDADKSIHACTAIIQWSHGRPSSKELAQAYLNRGNGYADRGDNDKAIADYTAAIHRDATLGNAFAARGVLYYKAGNFKQAVADLDAAIRLDPTSADSWAWRSRAKGQLGDANGANADEAHALQLDPSVLDNMSDDD